MDQTVRKGQRCPVCKKGAIVERSNDEYGRYLACSTDNPKNPNDPRSDKTIWNMGGVQIHEKTKPAMIILIGVLSVAFFALIFFVLTQTSLFGS